MLAAGLGITYAQAKQWSVLATIFTGAIQSDAK
jgi:hypothetical protein